MNPTELKRQIVGEAVGKLLDEAKVPARYHLKVVEALHRKMQEHEISNKKHEEQIARYESVATSHEHHNREHERQISGWDEIARHLQSIDHLKGDPGDPGEPGLDATPVDEEALVGRIVSMLPIPKNGEPGKNAVVDEDKIISQLISRLQKDKPLDISHIRNAQTFIKNGVQYKIEELMRGAGGSTGGGSTPLTPTGTVNGFNQVFGVVSQPSSVISDGATYFLGAGYSYSNGQITLDIAPSEYIRWYA